MTKYDVLSSATEPITLRVLPELAEEIGLNASLVLLQLAFWIRIGKHEHDGQYWTFQSVRDMQKKAFPFWSHMTIQRAIERLAERKLIVTRDDLNRLKQDNTRWFALNPEGFEHLQSVTLAALAPRRPIQRATDEDGLYQNVTGVYQDVTAPYQDVTTLPENTPENTQSAILSDDAIPDFVPPTTRKVLTMPRPQPDGGARVYSLIEAWLDAWSINVQRYRDGAHKTQLKGARLLADMDATPDEITAMCAERRAKGKQPNDALLIYLASDYAGWKQTAAPSPAAGFWGREFTE